MSDPAPATLVAKIRLLVHALREARAREQRARIRAEADQKDADAFFQQIKAMEIEQRAEQSSLIEQPQPTYASTTSSLQ